MPARQETRLEAPLGALCEPSSLGALGDPRVGLGARLHREELWAATKGKRAKVKKRARVGDWVDYEPLVALPDAAHEIDLAGPWADTRNTGRRALLACLFLGGMRVPEAAQLQRRDVRWSRGVIHIPASKTAAGIARDVPMHRMLFEAISEWWARHPSERPDALLFATATGRQRDRNNIRNRVLAPAIKRAEALLRDPRATTASQRASAPTARASRTYPPTRGGGRRSPGGRRPDTTNAT